MGTSSFSKRVVSGYSTFCENRSSTKIILIETNDVVFYNTPDWFRIGNCRGVIRLHLNASRRDAHERVLFEKKKIVIFFLLKTPNFFRVDRLISFITTFQQRNVNIMDPTKITLSVVDRDLCSRSMSSYTRFKMNKLVIVV